MKRNYGLFFLLIFLETVVIVYLGQGIVLGARLSNAKEQFFSMELKESYLDGLSAQYGYGSREFFHVLTRDMMKNGFHSPDHYAALFSPLAYGEDCMLSMYGRKESILKYYETILGDLKCFPVLKDSTGAAVVNFDNSWGAGRNYKGERKHEGTDIISSNNERGYFQIVSMSDGVVEKMGWLELGGYRIGIRTPKGAYIYYAHMCEYAPELKIGSVVKAGQVLGTMGDSGYSKVEGTTGNFDVHLHLGIYFNIGEKEYSVNPYFILKFLTE